MHDVFLGGAPGDRALHPPLLQDDNAIGERQQFGQIARDDQASTPAEVPHEALPDAPAVLVVEVEKRAAIQMERIMNPTCEGDAVRQVARAEAEGVVTGNGDIR